MSNYRRLYIEGACYFFTVVTWHRQPLFADAGHVETLRAAFRRVMKNKLFSLDAMVVLPDHLHCMWTLPESDSDFSGRWREIKKLVTRRIRRTHEQRLWQPRFWEHWIRGGEDWRRHMDYIHYNPVKHGLVQSPRDWPYSSFHRAVKKGWYDENWGRQCPENIAGMELE